MRIDGQSVSSSQEALWYQTALELAGFLEKLQKHLGFCNGCGPCLQERYNV
jgi:hypothetical protein